MLVGRDGLMRSQSRFSAEPRILKARVEDGAVRDAIGGARGVTTVAREGTAVIAAFAPTTSSARAGRWSAVWRSREVLRPVTAMRDRLLVAVASSVVALTPAVFSFLGGSPGLSSTGRRLRRNSAAATPRARCLRLGTHTIY